MPRFLRFTVNLERRFVPRLIGLSIDPPILALGLGGHWRVVVRWGVPK